MINTIVFDFGAVLLPIREEETHNACKALGAKQELFNQKEVFEGFEKGEFTADKFLETIQPFFFRKLFKSDLAKAWNAMLISPLESRIIDFLKRLKSEYSLILLSNTNELHIKCIKDKSGIFDYTQFEKQFNKVYYSHEMGMRKPDADIFERVISENDLTPENCFYIDDKRENTQAGEKAGFKTWHFNPAEEDIIDDFDKALQAHLAPTLGE